MARPSSRRRPRSIGQLRRYLIFDTRAREPARELIDAIDDYVEKLTGDRRTLHAQNHSIG